MKGEIIHELVKKKIHVHTYIHTYQNQTCILAAAILSGTRPSLRVSLLITISFFSPVDVLPVVPSSVAGLAVGVHRRDGVFVCGGELAANRRNQTPMRDFFTPMEASFRIENATKSL